MTFEGATRRYRDAEADAVHDLDLQVAEGEFLVLVGPSGCGKSTTLRMLAGLEACDTGHILIGDRDVTRVPPKGRDIAMVFQNYALYPHMTVAQNISFHLSINRMSKRDIAARVHEAAVLLDLVPYLDRKPAHLSGGQRQRVAMGRAIVRRPHVFLMDEPLSNLDAKLRVQTRSQIADLQRRFAVTTLYVTHDQVEALTMGDRIAVLRDGVMLQCDTPRAVFSRPANVFVAGFIGSPAMNLTTLTVDGEHVRFDGLEIALSRPQRESLSRPSITVGVRPESFRVVGADQPGVDVNIQSIEELGSDTYLYTSREALATDGEPTQITVRCAPFGDHQRGDRLRLLPDLGSLHLFDALSGQRLPD